MTEEVVTLVKIPISEIEQWIRERHNLPKVLTDFSIQGDSLVLHFNEQPSSEIITTTPPTRQKKRKRRKSRRKRNRMKTRGWQAVARITNSKGQKCTIYKPFVDALNGKEMTNEEQEKIVEKILRSNRNRPDAGSIRYYLENTLEYLKGGS
jgi:hypothetical protein